MSSSTNNKTTSSNVSSKQNSTQSTVKLVASISNPPLRINPPSTSRTSGGFYSLESLESLESSLVEPSLTNKSSTQNTSSNSFEEQLKAGGMIKVRPGDIKKLKQKGKKKDANTQEMELLNKKFKIYKLLFKTKLVQKRRKKKKLYLMEKTLKKC